MGSLYRPSTKTKAQEAAAALSPGKRKSEEERQLIFLRTALQQTIWTLDPESSLANHLKLTMDEIRRHNLATMLPARPTKTPRELNVTRDGSTASSEVLEHSNMDETIPSIETAPGETSHETGTEDIHEKQQLAVPEVLEEGIATTRKRALDDDEPTVPLAKRVRTWIGGVFATRT